MNFIPQQYLPVNNKGQVVTLDPGEKLAYHARTFQWREIPANAFTKDIIAKLNSAAFHGLVDNFFDTMDEEADKADCERRCMGCVITSLDLGVMASGHNRKPDGLEGKCKDIGCVPAITCRLTEHAEANTLAKIDPRNDKFGYILFNTAVPCLNCMKLVKARNVKVVVYKETREQDELDRPIMSAISMRCGITFLKVTE